MAGFADTTSHDDDDDPSSFASITRATSGLMYSGVPAALSFVIAAPFSFVLPKINSLLDVIVNSRENADHVHRLEVHKHVIRGGCTGAIRMSTSLFAKGSLKTKCPYSSSSGSSGTRQDFRPLLLCIARPTKPSQFSPPPPPVPTRSPPPPCFRAVYRLYGRTISPGDS